MGLQLWLRQKIGQILWYVGAVANRLSRVAWESNQAKRVRQWFDANGDKTLRLDYDLTAESTVLDVGGYEGQWTSDIFAKYCCTIHVFEPVPTFADNIQHRFRRNRKIAVHRHALGAITGEIVLSEEADSSSAYKAYGRTIRARMINVEEFLLRHRIAQIDLMKINIEGAEFDLIQFLLDTELIMRVANLQVQFHDFVPNAAERMQTIHQRLSRTHVKTYSYEFVWENWRVKESCG